MNEVHVGMPVHTSNGRIGAVRDIQSRGVEPEQIVVQQDNGNTLMLSHGMYQVVRGVLRIEDGVLNANLPIDATGTGAWGTTVSHPDESRGVDQHTFQTGVSDVLPGDEVRIPVIQEQAVVRTREVERGGVRVHKTVNEREEVIEQPTLREDVSLERVPVGRVIEVAPDVREEGDTLIIPVIEEMLVVEKRLVLKEEIRITRRRRTETEQVRVMLREEQAEVEVIDDQAIGDRQ